MEEGWEVRTMIAKNNTFFVQDRARQAQHERDKGGMYVKCIRRVRVIGIVQGIGE